MPFLNLKSEIQLSLETTNQFIGSGTKKTKNPGKEVWSAKTKDVIERSETLKVTISEY